VAVEGIVNQMRSSIMSLAVRLQHSESSSAAKIGGIEMEFQQYREASNARMGQLEGEVRRLETKVRRLEGMFSSSLGHGMLSSISSLPALHGSQAT
jgi:TolA-binding protein